MLRRVTVTVTPDRAEAARGALLDLCPEGFEERSGAALELVAYVDAEREAPIRRAFPDARSDAVAPGWERAWRAFHRPVRVGPLWVGPPWIVPDGGAIAVVVDPGQAFGTGAHPTTRLCLSLLLEQERGAVLDIGCGSGVLAIAAAKLDFDPVEAVDLEAEAVEATRRNAWANGVDVRARTADALTDDLPRASLVLVNVEPPVVEGVARRVSAERLIASGYLADDRLALEGWQRLDRRELDGWAAELYGR